MRRFVVFAPLGLLLAACGGGSGNSSGTTSATTTSSPIVAAADKTAGQGSEQMSLDGTIDLGGQGLGFVNGKLGLKATGRYDQNAQRGDLNATLELANAGSTTLNEVFDHNVFWVKSPLLAPLLGGKQWLKIDVGKSPEKLGFDFKALTGQNPADVLEQLRRTSSSVTTVGKDQVDGVATTHYRAALDPSKLPGDQKTASELEPLDVWVDDQGLIRKVHLDYTARVDSAKPARARIKLDMHFSHFGAKVDVTPPPDSESLDASSSGGLTG